MEQKGYFRSLTSLKGLFILIIAVHNTLLVTPLFSGVPGVAFIKLFGGALGNSMFFILSGMPLSFLPVSDTTHRKIPANRSVRLYFLLLFQKSCV